MKVGAILLAAGASSRMGAVKQLLPFRGVSLVQSAARQAWGSVCCSVFAVLGARSILVRHELATLPVNLLENTAWEKGIGSSICCGVAGARAIQPDLDAIVLLLADQPLVTAETINRLVASSQLNPRAIVVSSYSDTVGVPALFPRDTFNDLENLLPEQGAKQLFAHYQDRLVPVSVPEAQRDIDTPHNYHELSKLNYV